MLRGEIVGMLRTWLHANLGWKENGQKSCGIKSSVAWGLVLWHGWPSLHCAVLEFHITRGVLQLLCFRFSSPVTYLGKQRNMTQVLAPLPLTWENRMKLLLSAFRSHAVSVIWAVNQQVSVHVCTCSCATLPPCHSAFQLEKDQSS